MSYPPSTPTPRRFLLAKRGTQSSQTPTGPPRFQSTPRFGSSSVLKPTQGRSGLVDDVEEVEDGVEASSVGDEMEREGGGGGLNDSIEVESDAMTSQGDTADMSDSDPEPEPRDPIEPDSMGHFGVSDGSSPLEEREPKRRRVSISPMPDSPLEPEQDHSVQNNNNSRRGEPLATADHAPTTSFMDVDDDDDDDDAADETEAPPQPTFRPPPRFKPAEAETLAGDGLPAAFSPQRRGVKYLPGGLAAGLQGWLSDVKDWEGAADQAVARVAVEEIRPGRRMYLVRGRADGGGGAAPARFLLAGEGRLTGLGARALVGVGSVVVVGQPVWELELEGEVWTVSCDWSVS
ncbi:hypothetical protein AK830_g367 [Neonectria ditissima]|uniref:Uncharacterized protein n=1 Tax=Neonectria ditissima TaxID=78410 RepID=A0A0P7BH22_9HYPO|nr:hypothetical protein AK830_g367 [Neonectria ditissima]